MAPPLRDRWSHGLALALCGATFVLLVFGGLVTTTGAALAVPDWPTTFGYNMFLYPWSAMVGGIFYEHSHRLIGSLVGLLTVALAVWLWLAESRRWLRWLGVLALALVSAQGLLGGLRVVLVSEALAVVHGSLGPAFFALTVILAFATSTAWRGGSVASGPRDLRLRQLALGTTCVLYLQIVLGALLTHLGQRLDGHLAGAAVAAVLIAALVARVVRRHAGEPAFVRPGLWLGALLGLQLLLGLGAYLARFTAFELPAPTISALAVPVAHRIVAAVMLAAAVILTLRVYGMAAAAPTSVRVPVSLEQVAA